MYTKIEARFWDDEKMAPAVRIAVAVVLAGATFGYHPREGMGAGIERADTAAHRVNGGKNDI
jgi:hypothetical protein